jgi:hypothetical protein
MVGACSSVVGWGTMLWAGMSQVWSQSGHLSFQLISFFQPHYGPRVNSASNRNLPGGKEQPEHKPDNLTTICEPAV